MYISKQDIVLLSLGFFCGPHRPWGSWLPLSKVISSVAMIIMLSGPGVTVLRLRVQSCQVQAQTGCEQVKGRGNKGGGIGLLERNTLTLIGCPCPPLAFCGMNSFTFLPGCDWTKGNCAQLFLPWKKFGETCLSVFEEEIHGEETTLMELIREIFSKKYSNRLF